MFGIITMSEIMLIQSSRSAFDTYDIIEIYVKKNNSIHIDFMKKLEIQGIVYINQYYNEIKGVNY